MRPACSFSGCDRQAEARGFCHKHYCRWYKHGTVETRPRARQPLADRLRMHYKQAGPNDCWLWHGAKGGDGYGQIKMGARGTPLLPAHRASYMVSVGPIPEGMDIDHLCRTPACVNPAHLEPVTRRVNAARGIRHHPTPRPWLTAADLP